MCRAAPPAIPSTVLMNVHPRASLAGVSEILFTTPPMPDGKISPNISNRGEARRCPPDLQGQRRPGGGRLRLWDGDAPPGRQDRRTRQRLCGGSQEAGFRPRQYRHDRGAQRDSRHRRRHLPARNSWRPTCLSQAEHDTMASAVLVTDSAALGAEAVAAELERQIPLLAPRPISPGRPSTSNGKIIVVGQSGRQASRDIQHELAPEHLELCVDNPFDYLDGL